jgi:hypothetical protein
MQKKLKLVCLILLFVAQAFAQVDTTILIIPNTTLSSVSYHQQNYVKPTKLIFPNLTSVSGYVYFHDNVNLVSVEFPVLQNTTSYVYFHGNNQLKTIKAPNLTTIGGYLYVVANTTLSQLNICNITSVQTYTISGNNAIVDATPFCFQVPPPTNITLSNDSIFENLPPWSFIGKLAGVANPTDVLSYFENNPSPQPNFRVRNDSLFSAKTFSYYSANQYNVSLGVSNQLGDKFIKNFLINIKQAPPSNDTDIIVIPNTTLSTVYYDQTNYLKPTRIIFSNLTTVTGYIYFHENVNLISVEFPKLTTASSYVYFHQNLNLKSINFPLLQNTASYFYCNGNTQLNILNAPNLTTIGGLLYISLNTSLTQMNICSITSVQSVYITGNTAVVDAVPFCFQVPPPTNIVLTNDSIFENQIPNTFIGKIIGTGNPGNVLTYSFVNSTPLNYPFNIVGDSLFSSQVFIFNVQNQYPITLKVVNQVGGSFTKNFTIFIKPAPSVDTTVIIIADTTLNSIYYHNTNYTKPTKIIFPNLKRVNGYIYFHQNINLFSVDFPLLDKTLDSLNNGNSYVYFNGNLQLRIINAPNLNKISGYLYVQGNLNLNQLNICNIKFVNTYSITNNNLLVDTRPFCFEVPAPTNLILTTDSVSENRPVGTFISKIIGTANPTDILTYSLSATNAPTIPFFVRNDSLFTLRTFVYNYQNQYNLSLNVKNQLGDFYSKNFIVHVKPSLILPSIPSALFANYETYDSTSGWTQYYNDLGTPGNFADDVLLLSIHKNGQNIGNVGDGTFTLKTVATAFAGSGVGVFVNNPNIPNDSAVWAMNRYWLVTPTFQPTSQVKIRFYYNDQDLVDLNGSYPTHNLVNQNLIFYKAIQGNPDPTTNIYGASSIIRILPSPNVVSDTTWVYHSLSDSTQYAEFKVASFSGGGVFAPNNLNVLSLRLLNFTSQVNGNEISLSWITVDENNCKNFVVERSYDGINFEKIDLVKAQNNAVNKYKFLDNIDYLNKENSIIFYRLKMVDVDNSFTYSNIIKVLLVLKNNLHVNIYPNPVSSNRNLNIHVSQFAKDINAYFYNDLGQLLFTQKLKNGLNQIVINNFNKGIYHILVLDNKLNVFRGKVNVL